jgi:predicted patatin/cPLA2 family phospholipase
MRKKKVYSKLSSLPKGQSSEKVIKGCLCLEGGAFRGCYTAGVLDCLMENDINLETTIGVSAGSMCGLLYVSGDIGRAARINLQYRHDPRYVGIRAYKKNKGLIGFDFCLKGINKELPMNTKRFIETKRRFIAVCTSLDTGKAAYFEKGRCSDIYKAVQASASMPYISKPVIIDGKEYLDGGVACKVPYQFALNEKQEKIVIVLTRERGYRKKENRLVSENALIMYHHHEAFAQKLAHTRDNAAKEYEGIEKLEEEGRVFCFYPSRPINISRLEGDMEKLGDVYHLGYQDCLDNLDRLKEYLSR